MKKIILILSLVLLFGFFIRSCTDQRLGNEGAVAEEYAPEAEVMTIRHSIGTEVKNLDPAFPLTFDEGNLFFNIFETLVKLDSSGNVTPGAASFWEVSEDNLTYTFHIRDTMWSDGSKLTSRDFFNGFKYILEEETESPFAYKLFPILNAKAFHDKLLDEDELGISVVDDNTLEIILERPREDMLSLLTLPYFTPLKSEQRFQLRIENELYPNATNGRYFIDKESKEGFIILKKNPYHYDYESEKDKDIVIELITIESSSSRISAFQTGVVDIASNILPKEADYLMGEEARYEFTGYGNFYYILNSSKYPFNDRALRDIVFMSSQVELISEEVKGDRNLASLEMLSSRMNPNMYNIVGPQISENNRINEDENRDLGVLFRESGFIDRISILSFEEEMDIKTAIALKSVLEKNLGIGVDLNISSIRDLPKEELLNYDIIQYPGFENIESVLDIMEFWIWNYPEISLGLSEELEAEIIQRNISANEEKYLELLVDIGNEMNEGNVFLPVYNRSTTNLIKPYIQGLDISKHGFLLYDNIMIEKK